jgi:hypothetical protein
MQTAIDCTALRIVHANTDLRHAGGPLMARRISFLPAAVPGRRPSDAD